MGNRVKAKHWLSSNMFLLGSRCISALVSPKNHTVTHDFVTLNTWAPFFLSRWRDAFNFRHIALNTNSAYLKKSTKKNKHFIQIKPLFMHTDCRLQEGFVHLLKKNRMFQYVCVLQYVFSRYHTVDNIMAKYREGLLAEMGFKGLRLKVLVGCVFIALIVVH